MKMHRYNTAEEVAENIRNLVDDGYKVCVWGTGEKAVKLGTNLLNKCSITIDCFCDNAESKWGKEVVDGKYCITPDELIKQGSEYVCIVMINDTSTVQMIEELKKSGVELCCGFYDVLCSNYALHCFFPFTLEEKGKDFVCGVKQDTDICVCKEIESKTVIYTCIIGGYDKAQVPQVIEKECDYYLISDVEPDSNTAFEWIPLSTLDIPKDLDNSLINRYCKINAHKIFPQYKYSIYIDGNVLLKKAVSKKYLSLLNNKKAGIACLKRWCKVSDIYEDGIHVDVAGLAESDVIFKQLELYWKEGLPRHHGQICGRILIREHNNPACRKVMETWWKEVLHKAHRDQLSFMYALWKNGYNADDIGWIDYGGWETEDYFTREHENIGRKTVR